MRKELNEKTADSSSDTMPPVDSEQITTESELEPYEDEEIDEEDELEEVDEVA